MANGNTQSIQQTRRGAVRGSRAGISTVELAVCLPVLLLLVIGCIECSSIIFLKQGLSAAAYEGVRAAADPDGTIGAANSRCMEILNARDITNATVTITPKNVKQVGPGQTIEVQLTAPSTGNRFLPASFVADLQVTAAAVMAKE